MNVLIVGVFDLFHRGHLEFLNEGKEFGDTLYVLINGDSFTEKYKRRPIYSEQDRLAIVSGLSCVDFVEITNSADIKPYLKKYQIDTIVHGDDWNHASYLKQICVTEEYLKEQDIKIKYTRYYSGISTSEIIKKINTRSIK